MIPAYPLPPLPDPIHCLCCAKIVELYSSSLKLRIAENGHYEWPGQKDRPAEK